MSIAIGSDHGGFSLKIALKKHLEAQGFEMADYGTYDENSCDYPAYAEKVALSVSEEKHPLGILVCGTGIGVAMAAGKIPGIRAATVGDCFSARYTRLHNDANILCLGERTVGPGLACQIAEIFLNTPFEGGRHKTRVDMIAALEKKYAK